MSENILAKMIETKNKNYRELNEVIGGRLLEFTVCWIQAILEVLKFLSPISRFAKISLQLLLSSQNLLPPCFIICAELHETFSGTKILNVFSRPL